MIHKNTRNMRDFIRIWFFWKREALICAGIILFISAIYILTASARYSVSAKIVLLPRSTEGTVITTGSNDKIVTSVTMEDVNTEIEILRSDDIARSTVTTCKNENIELGLAPKTTKWIANAKKSFSKFLPTFHSDSTKNDSIAHIERDVKALLSSIAVSNSVASNIILLKLKCADPQAGTRLLNLYCNEYIKCHNKIFTQQHGAEFLQAQKDTLKKIFSLSQDSLLGFESQYSIIDEQMQNQYNLEALTKLENQIKDIDLKTALTNSRISLLQIALRQKQSDLSLTEEMRSVPLLVELDKSIVSLLMKRNELASRYTPTSREYVSIEKQLENAYEQRKMEIQKALRSDSMELESQQVQKLSIIEKIAFQKKIILDLNAKSKAHEELQNRADQTLKNYLLYSAKSEDARILSAKAADNISSVNIADQADVPLEKAFPKRKLMALTSLLIACIFCILLPFFLEVFDLRLKTVGDIETALNIPVAGTILKHTVKKTEINEFHSDVKELIKRLDYLSYSEKLKTFCFSSVTSGMGCSTIMELMIRSLQKMNLDLRILFIDMNLFSPALHKLLFIEQTPGLMELLNGTATYQEAIRFPGNSNVYFLPTGNTQNCQKILSRHNIELLLKDLSSQFDLVLIDASLSHNSLLFSRLASCCDRTLMVMASGSTHLNSTRRLIETLKKEGVNISDAVLTQYDYLIPQWLYNFL